MPIGLHRKLLTDQVDTYIESPPPMRAILKSPIKLVHTTSDAVMDNKDCISIIELESYFGKDVHRALAVIRAEREKKKQGGDSELMDLLISRKWHDRFAQFTNDPV